MIYRPSKRPSEKDAAAETIQVFYAGEPIQVDLHFEPEVRVHGQITNDFGDPLEGAEVHLGVIRDIRRPDSRNNISWRCSYLDESRFAEDGDCGVVRYLPHQFLSARTDAQGRYELKGIPRDASMIAQVEYRKEYPVRSLSLHTAEGTAERGTKFVGHGGEFNEMLIAPREMRVRVVDSSSRPVTGVTVTARGRDILRAGSQARTGADGRALLQLPTGNYQLIAEPAPEAGFVRAITKFTVSEKPRTQEIDVELATAAGVTIQVLEDGTGKPIEGAVVFSEQDDTKGATRLQSQTVYVDNPVTDAEGKLQAAVEPGRRRFFAQRNAYSSSRRSSSEWFDVSSGKETTVAITLPRESEKNTAQSGETHNLSDAQKQFHSLRETWHQQWLLGSRGRYRIRLQNSLHEDVPRDRLVELLKSCDGKSTDESIAILATAFSALKGKFAPQELIFDRERMRGSWLNPEDPSNPAYLFVFNGQETITYQHDNAQADIYGIDNAFVGFTHLSDLNTMIGTSSEISQVAIPDDQWQASTESVGDRLKIVLSQPGQSRSECLVDPKTGFVYHMAADYSNGRSVNETWQFGPRLHSNGAVVPAIRFECQYMDNRLSSAEIYLIDDFQPMERVPPETFRVAVDPGTNVLDYRGMPRDQFGSNERARSEVIREPVNDVVARANEFAPRKPAILKKGDKAPPLDVATWLGGDATNAAPQLDGQIVLVNFSAHWCGPCRSQLPQLEAASRHFAKDGLVTIGIYEAGDSDADVKKDVERAKLSYHIAIDKVANAKQGFGQTAAAYGVDSVPQMAVIGRDGKIAYLGSLDQALEVVDRLVKQSTSEK